MFQIRFHGRGGQGVVSAAQILSLAAFHEGKHAQAFPSFGSERMGAPVVSFCRIDNKEIRLRDPVVSADALIIQDPTLLATAGLFDGLSPDGFVLINSGKSIEDLNLPPVLSALPHTNIASLPATDIAIKHIGRPLPNAVMLGGLAALAKIVALSSIEAGIGEEFAPPLARVNILAAREAYNAVSNIIKGRPAC